MKKTYLVGPDKLYKRSLESAAFRYIFMKYSVPSKPDKWQTLSFGLVGPHQCCVCCTARTYIPQANLTSCGINMIFIHRNHVHVHKEFCRAKLNTFFTFITWTTIYMYMYTHVYTCTLYLHNLHLHVHHLLQMYIY